MSRANPYWVFGVCLCVLGSTATSLGLVLQRLSYVRNQAQPQEKRVPFYHQLMWLFGFTVFLLAQVLNMVAMGLAPASIISCLGAWSVLSNVLLAHFVLHERLTRTSLLCIVGLLIGGGLVMHGAPHKEASWVCGDPQILLYAFGKPSAIVFIVVSAILLLSLFVVIRVSPWTPGGLVSRRVSLCFAALASLAGGWNSILFRCISLTLLQRRIDRARSHPWLSVHIWIILVMGLCCGGSEIWLINQGLLRGEALVVVPTYYILGMLAQLLAAAFYFEEFETNGVFQVPLDHFVMFLAGVAVLLLCVGVLGRREANAEAPHEENIEQTAPDEVEVAEHEKREDVEIEQGIDDVPSLQRVQSTPSLFTNSSRSKSTPTLQRVRSAPLLRCRRSILHPQSYGGSTPLGRSRLYTVSLFSFGIA